MPPDPEKNIENILEKGENAGYQHFLLFQKCFLSILSKINFGVLATFELLSANASNLDNAKILSHAKGLRSLTNLHDKIFRAN